MYHYVYRITNLILNKHYYGSRTSNNISPELDLGFNYYSSSTDKDFIDDQKKNIHNYKYKIVKLCDTRKQAIAYEIILHEKFNVAQNNSFYNLSKQTTTGFDTTGTKASIETREKLKISRKNRSPITDNTREKLSKALSGKNNPRYGKPGTFTGKKHSVKSREKMSKSHKGYKASKSTKKKISESLKGNTRRLGTMVTLATRKKISEAGMGRVFSTETRKKISEKRKLYWKRKKLSEEITNI